MEASPLCSSTLLPSLSPKLNCTKRSSGRVVVAAARRGSSDQNYGSQSVDESMIVLRKRIHEMKIIERNYEPPAHWMEWEKQYYAHYDEIICNAVGLLQSQLMNTRPCLAIGMLAVISLSVPASTAMIVLRFLDVANGALSAIHHIG
ncbi:uncharacterized protein LOC119985379 [Tripterygium wilfordii]|uniref:uncharacterized protein LOC119985379 n=1 Tax=Tripterygium wilfordii TaxID=458696 RepID=UPI0018F86071|nr:uncharacterized protein LOC119985379 [Tripterygium wilfordii]